MSIADDVRQRVFESPYQQVYINILYTAAWLEARTKPVFRAHGLTGQQYNILRILRGRHPEACSAGEVKAVMIDQSPDVTRLMDRLVAKGLVARTVCPANRRKVDLVITDAGLALLDTLAPQLRELVESPFRDHLSEDEARRLSDLLDRYRGG